MVVVWRCRQQKETQVLLKEKMWFVNKFVVVLYESIPLNIYQDILYHFKTKSRQDTNTFIIILLPFCHILYRIKLGRGKKQKQIKQNNK